MAEEWQILRDWMLGARAASVAEAPGIRAPQWASLQSFAYGQSAEFNKALQAARNASLCSTDAVTDERF
jgi:hypothetical protein